MTPNEMQTVLRKLESLAEGWGTASGIPPIERDLALDKLRLLYDSLRTAEPVVEQVTETSVSINLDEVLSVDVPESETDMKTVEVVRAAMQPEPAKEPVVEPEPSYLPEPEAVMEPDPEPVMPSLSPVSRPEPAPKPVAPTLFGTDDSEELLRHRQKQRVLRSLYDIEEPASAPRPELVVKPEPIPQPAPAEILRDSEEVEDEDEMVIEEIEISVETAVVREKPEPFSEKGAVLGDVINPHVQTLADSLASHRPEPAYVRTEPANDLRRMIGINDRFLMIRDLFGGDATAYDEAIGAVNSFDDFDDCMIYIAENYAWNPNSDGAKLLMELIQRKLS